ncbi:MAG: thiamine pyrophosphate-binding protein [Burkholderiales bacterium]|nr:thiamine pyrophosphate-binding protein [Burkholderiales bacterium]OJX06363.1 MAG: acetolactate synthase [Burkholderiales bacterium 70-64]
MSEIAAGGRLTGAQALVRMLLEYRVEVVFGVPGDTSLSFYEALYDAGDRIRHVMARDERSATFMADAYARLSHRPGVCECPSGAGALYSVPGVAEANASSIPVILFTSGVSLAGEGKGTITEMEHHKLFEPVTKFSSFLKTAEKIPETVRRAFRIATSGRPGAVHLAFPTETMTGPVAPERVGLHAEPECRSYPAYRTRGSAETIAALAAQLADAWRPVIVAGGGVNHSGANTEVCRLAERLGAPVVTTISGQGTMPDDHPLALGVVGDNGFHPHAHRAVEEADVLLYVGCKMGSVSTIKWTLPSPRPGRRILQIDLDPTVLGNNFENTLSVAGDARLVLDDLLAQLPGPAVPPSAWVRELNVDRDRFWADSQAVLHARSTPLKAQRVVHELNRRLPSPSIVIADAGTPTPHITRFLRLGGDGSRVLIPRSFGGLGYAIPAVVGAWFARPDARPVALFGDGSLGMSAGELETLVRLNVPAVLVHFNNGCFGWIKTLQSLHSRSKFMSVDFTPGDMSRVAAAYGIRSWRVEDPDQLGTALDEAFAHRGPAFLDVVTEPLMSDLPPVYSWLKAAGRDPLRRPAMADATEREEA